MQENLNSHLEVHYSKESSLVVHWCTTNKYRLARQDRVASISEMTGYLLYCPFYTCNSFPSICKNTKIYFDLNKNTKIYFDLN